MNKMPCPPTKILWPYICFLNVSLFIYNLWNELAQSTVNWNKWDLWHLLICLMYIQHNGSPFTWAMIKLIYLQFWKSKPLKFIIHYTREPTGRLLMSACFFFCLSLRNLKKINHSLSPTKKRNFYLHNILK